MMIKMKHLLIGLAAAVTLVVTLPPSTTGYMFGKKYDTQRDFSCCKGDQLYAHHYYSFRLFWVNAGTGYTDEAIGKPVDGGCNIQCDQ